VNDKDKPLAAMNDIEREHAWDSISDPIHGEMLTDARCSEVNAAIVLAAIILVAGDGTRRCVTHVAEYGDNEGVSSMLDTARQIRRSGKLLDGERVEVVTLEKPLDQFQWRPVQEPAKPSGDRS
jgi:hypothetical protein